MGVRAPGIGERLGPIPPEVRGRHGGTDKQGAALLETVLAQGHWVKYSCTAVLAAAGERSQRTADTCTGRSHDWPVCGVGLG